MEISISAQLVSGSIGHELMNGWSVEPDNNVLTGAG